MAEVGFFKHQPPEFLYKYRSFQEDKDKKRVKEIITDSKIYFSSPAAFNDPFDCKLEKDYFDPKTKEEERKMLERMLSKEFPNESPQSIHQMVCATRGNPNIMAVTEGLQKYINNGGVFSLAEEKDNILLWSHYADGHKGLCLEFSTVKIKNWLTPITYQNERPQNGALKGEEEQFKDILCTKAKDWEYEKEWRIINFKGEGHGLKPFPKENLVGIIFGCEMPDDDKKEIVELVKEHRPDIIESKQLKQAKIATGKFALTIKPYEH